MTNSEVTEDKLDRSFYISSVTYDGFVTHICDIPDGDLDAEIEKLRSFCDERPRIPAHRMRIVIDHYPLILRFDENKHLKGAIKKLCMDRIEYIEKLKIEREKERREASESLD